MGASNMACPRLNLSSLSNTEACGSTSPCSFGRHLSARVDAFHIWQLVRDALVALDASRLAGQEVARVNFGCARSLFR